MKPGKELLFLALGGSGEIGMNVNLYGCEGKWVMVDLGLTFADPAYPGVELVLPDLAFIEERRDDLLGIVLTHGHEDHIGAIPYLAHDLGVPLYATPFTAGLIAGKLEEEGLTGQVEAQHRRDGGRFPARPVRLPLHPARPFDPRGQCAADRHALRPRSSTPATGSWTTRPSSATPRTEAELRAIGDAGVLALGLRFDQRLPGGVVGLRARRPRGARRGDRRRPSAGCSSPPSPPTPRG